MGLLGLFFLKPSPRKQRPPSKKSSLAKEIVTALDFNEEQFKQFEQLAQKHREQILVIKKQEEGLMNQYFGTLSDSAASNIPPTELSAEISSLLEEKLLITYQHFEAVRAMCSEDQLKQFDRLIEMMMKVLITGNTQPQPPPPPH